MLGAPLARLALGTAEPVLDCLLIEPPLAGEPDLFPIN